MYSQEEKVRIFDEICEEIITGSSLRSAIEGKISSKTFFEWMNQDDDKVKQYARACDVRHDNIFEDIMLIADTKTEDPQSRRVQIDARKWMLGKMNPKKYGDKVDITTDGEKINNPTIIRWGDKDVQV